MSRGESTRFAKGVSGNPAGRPRLRRPHVSAFDIIFDKMLSVTQNGIERDLTIDEALQLQTYQAALKGSRMATRQILKMIERREVAIAKLSPAPVSPMKFEMEYDSNNADEAMQILGIAERDGQQAEGERSHRPLRIASWAVQAALSRPGRRKLGEKEVDDIKRVTLDAHKLKWPRKRVL